MSRNEINVDLSGLFGKIQSHLQDKGIDLDIPDELNFFDELNIFGGRKAGEEDEKEEEKEGHQSPPRVKVVCVSPDLKESVEEMGRKQRDQVVMVRVDAETLQSLDEWVATKAVKSRSEAAALFIREGLKVRADELEKLRDALREVEEAQERLKNKAREIFGHED